MKRPDSLTTMASAIALNDPNKKWPYTQKDKRRRVERMTPIYQKAGIALGKPEWSKPASDTDFNSFTVTKNLAEIRAMRDNERLYSKRQIITARLPSH